MHRVELKVAICKNGMFNEKLFLMHRVELKAAGLSFLFSAVACVPNAPCGVERRMMKVKRVAGMHVPNAPCGVESRTALLLR